ncbi:MAG TPA: hypothetical protein VHE12_05485 [bacterium]|nr:hypothetical protein [bacterium]
MENINNLPPQLTPRESQSIPAKPIEAAAQQTKQLAELGQEKPVQMPDLGTKVDLKV